MHSGLLSIINLVYRHPVSYFKNNIKIRKVKSNKQIRFVTCISFHNTNTHRFLFSAKSPDNSTQIFTFLEGDFLGVPLAGRDNRVMHLKPSLFIHFLARVCRMKKPFSFHLCCRAAQLKYHQTSTNKSGVRM